jgi:predicted phage terminase large subunit-like protein
VIKSTKAIEHQRTIQVIMLATAQNLRLVHALCRTDFVSFVQKAFCTLSPGSVLRMNYHLWALAYHLELVRCGKIKRLIINFPPRTLKSLMTSVAFPAFVLGHDPSKRFIVVSYGLDLAIKLNNDFRRIIDAPSYQSLFPLMQTAGAKNTELEVSTTRSGYRLAASIEGALTGRGGDILIVDEPLKPSEALKKGGRDGVNNWFCNTLLSRLDNMSTGAIIVVMQRLHDDDLVGMLLRSSEKWVHLKLPAIAETEEKIQIGPDKFHIRRINDILHPERMPRSELESRRTLDPETFAAHYQQTPIPPGGIIIRRPWVRYYDVLPIRNPSSVVLQSWDTGYMEGESHAWSVCTTWLIQDGKFYLMDVLRERLEYPTLRTRAIAHAHTYNPNKIVIEDVGLGTGLIQDLRKVSLPVIAVRPERNKKTRAQIQAAKFEAGLVFFPKQAPWLSDYEAEIFAFPNVRFDDQLDSTSQALARDHSDYNLEGLSEGMASLSAGLAFEPFIQSLYRSKFG